MGELSKCSAVNGGGVPRNFDFGMNIFELPTPSPPPRIWICIKKSADPQTWTKLSKDCCLIY
jgi:hypothetical protein